MCVPVATVNHLAPPYAEAAVVAGVINLQDREWAAGGQWTSENPKV